MIIGGDIVNNLVDIGVDYEEPALGSGDQEEAMIPIGKNGSDLVWFGDGDFVGGGVNITDTLGLAHNCIIFIVLDWNFKDLAAFSPIDQTINRLLHHLILLLRLRILAVYHHHAPYLITLP